MLHVSKHLKIQSWYFYKTNNFQVFIVCNIYTHTSSRADLESGKKNLLKKRKLVPSLPGLPDITE